MAAPSRYGKHKQVLFFDATGDSTSDTLLLSGLSCDDGATVKDGNGDIIWKATGSEQIVFACPLEVEGLEFDAGTGDLWAYIK
jgi:hypothetical protein